MESLIFQAFIASRRLVSGRLCVSAAERQKGLSAQGSLTGWEGCRFGSRLWRANRIAAPGRAARPWTIAASSGQKSEPLVQRRNALHQEEIIEEIEVLLLGAQT